ncbi:MAG: hypothetical protein M3167_03595 [Acidobacteriota bacterium]|nr:hypothetical protein [Acidobacteriota bacterium]
MNRKTILATLAGLCIGVAVCLAADGNMGTWKLNEAKSKLSPGGNKNTMVVYTAAGDAVKVVTDGVGPEGKPLHTEWTGKYDGKDYPVTGDAASDTRAYTKVDANTLKISVKKGGKETTTVNIVMAADGKSRTVTTMGTDAAGKKTTSVAVYDKQ